MKMDLIEDLKRGLRRDLRQLGIKASNNDSERDLLRRWFDYEARTIPPRTRNVEESQRFVESRKKLSADETVAVEAIIEKLRRGDDVNGHLSKGILNADKSDLLIADWRIHHIHISNTKKSPKDFFFKRADHLAFVIINSANAYLLDISPHKEENIWSKDDLQQIVKDTWPSLLAPYQFIGKLEPDVAISPAERDGLRKAGINVPVVIGDSFVIPPGGGITAAGFSALVGRTVDRTLNFLAKIQIYLESYPEVSEQLARDLGCGSNELSLKLEWAKGDFCFQERKSGKYLTFNMAIVTKAAAAAMRRKKNTAHRLTVDVPSSKPSQGEG
jgi:hypothetical protein